MLASPPALRTRFVRQTVLAGLLLAALGAGASAQAARVGHARMVSPPGQPLAVELALREVTPEQQATLSASAAPADAWREAGLTPPVALDSLSFQVTPGPVAGMQIIRARSTQAFHGGIADLLLDIRSSSGQLRHQVSVMAADARSPAVVLAASEAAQGNRAVASRAGVSSAASAGGADSAGGIRVKRGDTLYGIARSNAVPGVSVYQMMMALQAINPDAFIGGNVHRLKAGATLRLPNADELALLSDAQARRLFAEQGEAFAAYRERIAGLRGTAASTADAAKGQVAQASPAQPAQADAPARDQLVLSSNSASSDAADDRLAADKNIADSRERIAQLEDNVKALSQAVGQASDGSATASSTAVATDVTAGVAAGASADAASMQAGAGSGGSAAVAQEGGPASAGQAGQQAGSHAAGVAAGTAAGVTAAEQAEGQAGAQEAGAQAAAQAAGQAPGQTAGQTAAPGQTPGAAAAPTAGPSAGQAISQTGGQAARGADQQLSWWQDNMWGLITGLLALVVLLLVWWLRRSGVNRGDGERGTMITEDMVRQKLEQIDLDLDDSPEATRRDGNSL